MMNIKVIGQFSYKDNKVKIIAIKKKQDKNKKTKRIKGIK